MLKVSATVAEVIIAETGGDMRIFPTGSWAGTTPGFNESAGRAKPTKTREGNHYLKGALDVAALAASRSKRTYYLAGYKRVASRPDPTQALVAVERTMLIAAWHILSTGELYRDPGADYLTQRAPARAKSRAISQLESLGFKVAIEPLP